MFCHSNAALLASGHLVRPTLKISYVQPLSSTDHLTRITGSYLCNVAQTRLSVVALTTYLLQVILEGHRPDTVYITTAKRHESAKIRRIIWFHQMQTSMMHIFVSLLPFISIAMY